MIRLHRVCKVFDSGPMKLPALSDISFTVDKGEFVVLSGASGAGKTTLLRLLYVDEQASEGEIEVAGYDVTALRHRDVPLLRRRPRGRGRPIMGRYVAYALAIVKAAKRRFDPESSHVWVTD